MHKVTIIEDEVRIGTASLAKAFNRRHQVILELIERYRSDFEYFSVLKKRKLRSTGGRQASEYMLNLSQLMLLISRMRTTPIVNAVLKSLIDNSDIIKAYDLIKKFDADDIQCKYVYAAIDSQCRVKIGISNNPEQRIKNLNIGNADKLELIFTKKANKPRYESEVILHKKCSDFHIRSEWFSKEAIELLELHGQSEILDEQFKIEA
jgi:hypothetical protein